MFGNQVPHWHSQSHKNKPDLVLQWIHSHFSWLHQTSEAKRHDDDYWAEVDLILQQFRGLHRGYNDHCGEDRKLSETALFMLQMDGDLEAVIPLLSAEPDAAKPVEAAATQDINVDAGEPNAKCSALI